MKKEYDFTDAEQGKFYCPLEELEIPIYIENKVQQILISKAKQKNKSVSDLVNHLLKSDIEIAESLQ